MLQLNNMTQTPGAAHNRNEKDTTAADKHTKREQDSHAKAACIVGSVQQQQQQQYY
jgi:hypothetical protein